MAQTYIAPTITIDGEITGNEPVNVSGTVKGQVNLESTFTVDKSGYVEADVTTQHLLVEGKLAGNVEASQRIEVKTEGKLIGDIKAPRIHIADGAAFKGRIEMDVE